MTGEHDGEFDRKIMSNAGRCDICGQTIDMRDANDTLSLVEYGDLDDDLKEKHDLTDQDAIDAVADAMERVADSGAGLELANVIREEGQIRVHGSCLDETNYSVLETEVPGEYA
jgi:hypothetical protein